MAQKIISSGQTSEVVTQNLNDNFTELYNGVDASVSTVKITDAAITTAKIADNAVTAAKLGSDVTKSTFGLSRVNNISITSGTAAPSGGSVGDIYIQYA